MTENMTLALQHFWKPPEWIITHQNHIRLTWIQHSNKVSRFYLQTIIIIDFSSETVTFSLHLSQTVVTQHLHMLLSKGHVFGHHIIAYGICYVSLNVCIKVKKTLLAMWTWLPMDQPSPNQPATGSMSRLLCRLDCLLRFQSENKLWLLLMRLLLMACYLTWMYWITVKQKALLSLTQALKRKLW